MISRIKLAFLSPLNLEKAPANKHVEPPSTADVFVDEDSPIHASANAAVLESKPLPKGVSAALQEILAAHKNDSEAQRQIENLANSPGFQKLKTCDQLRLLYYVGGTGPENAEARQHIGRELGHALLSNDTPKQQASRLEQFLETQPGIPFNARFNGEVETSYQLLDLSDDSRQVHIAIFGDHQITIHRPAAQQPPHDNTEDIAEALAQIPSECRRALTSVIISDSAPSVEVPNHAPYMEADSDGKVWVYPQPENPGPMTRRSSLLHEAGHVLSMKAFGEYETDKGWLPWKNAMKKEPLEASEYARVDAMEDFSETLVLYHDVLDTPREQEWRKLMPTRFQLIDNLLESIRSQ